MLISSSLPNFVNGVSQQPFTLRLNSQAELQENGLSTAALGLTKRPPTKHLAKVPLTTSDIFMHTINRDESERYIVVVLNGDLRVYDLEGNPKAVHFPNGYGYLGTDGSSASSSFAAVSVADHTFIANKAVTVRPSSAVSPTRPHEALVVVKQGNYGKTYRILINGSEVATFSTPAGDLPEHAVQIGTDYIASRFERGTIISPGSPAVDGHYETVQVQDPYGEWTTEAVWVPYKPAVPPTYSGGLDVAGFNTYPWSLSRKGSVLCITNAEADFSISTADDFNDNAMKSIKSKVASFTDLPANPGVSGFTVEIAGDVGGSKGAYFVQYKLSQDTPGQTAGVWSEVAQPGTVVGVERSTMPHVLIRNADGSFTFQQASWEERVAGSPESNPDPSYVGRKISDVFFYRNRLGFLSDENVIFSEAGKYFNPYRTTMTALLDADPIDVACTHTKVSLLKYALQFNKQLLLFSDQAQFVIDQSDALTPKTISIKLSTEFPASTLARPVGVGKNVYFTANKGSWSVVREYFVDANNTANDSIDTTAHIPQYVPANISKIAASTNEDILVLLSPLAKNVLYVYKYYYSASEKLQSAWSKWVLGSQDHIVGVEVLDSTLYLLVLRGTELFFESLDVSNTDYGNTEPFPVRLDRKVLVPASALTFNGTHTIISRDSLPYPPVASEDYCVVVSTDSPRTKPGVVASVIQGATQLKIKGDLTGNSLVFGKRYTFRYTLSPIVYRTQQAGGGQRADTDGRLQVRKIAFNYADSGYFKVRVVPFNRTPYEYVFAGMVLGATSRIGTVNMPTGNFRVPVMARNDTTEITLESDSPLPCSFLSADWEGFYVKRSKQV